MRIKVTLAAGLALSALVVGLTLTGSPTVLAGENGIFPEGAIAIVNHGGYRICQAGETLPRGTTRLRLSLLAVLGPRVGLTVSAGGHLLAHGSQESGWDGGRLTVPIDAPASTSADARVCLTLAAGASGPLDETVGVLGLPSTRATAAVGAGKILPGRMRIEYLRPDSRSWLSSARSVARRMGLASASGGAGIALVAAALMLAALACGSWSILRELR
jgi:hypothetical protein